MIKVPGQLTKILDYLKRPGNNSAGFAKERLQIIIAHERNQRERPDYLESLQRDLLDVIAKYVKINREDIKVELARKEDCSILELNVVLPA